MAFIQRLLQTLHPRSRTLSRAHSHLYPVRRSRRVRLSRRLLLCRCVLAFHPRVPRRRELRGVAQ